MRTSVRAIIPYNTGIILIHRIKEENGKIKDYYVFPGGGLEENESYEECLIREIKEELGITIKITIKLYEITNNDKFEVFFLCEYIDGRLGSGVGPEFTGIEYKDKGKYLIEVVSIEDLDKINLLPAEICQRWIVENKKYNKLKGRV